MKNIWQTTKKPILALAPMAGYTDPAFRLICLENGADIVYTEMISVESLWRKNKKTLTMLNFLPNEKNIILQLFGNNPESFKKALQVMRSLPKISRRGIQGIDINFGCPAPKVTKTGSGAALMNNKKLARQIIQAVLNNTSWPVSIKIRSQVKQTSATEFIKYIKDLPISAVMVHGRSFKQGFTGEIDFKMIKKVKQLLPNIPVLANGRINTTEDAKIILAKTNADGVGIARGALGNPFIFKQIKKYLKNQNYTPINFKQNKKIAIQHATFFLKYSDNLIPLRKHLVHYVKGFSNATELRQKIIKIETLKELESI